MVFWLAGTAQEAGADGRSGTAAGILVRVLLMGVPLDVDSFVQFYFCHCGSPVSTLVLSSETECTEALQWSPTPVGQFSIATTSRDQGL